MLDNTEIILTVATGVAAVITGSMQMIKTQEYIPSKYIPLATLVIGVVVGIAGGIIVFNVSPVIGAVGGLLAGLAAGGFYNLGKSVTKDK